GLSRSRSDRVVRVPFTASVEREGERRLRDRSLRLIVVLHLDAVVGVETLAVRVTERVSAVVVVGHDRHRTVRTPQDLAAKPGRVVELSVRLPTVDEPRLDLQLVIREDLYAHPVEKPRRVRRDG